MQTLTEEQAEALEMEGAKCVLIAGAGSGKTHTMVARIQRDTERTPPELMAVVTFTNAAAAELRDRLEAIGIPPQSFGHIGTLHSYAARILARRGQTLEMATEKQINRMALEIKKQLGAMARGKSVPEIWRACQEPPQFGNARAIGMAMRRALKEAKLTHPDMLLVDLYEALLADRTIPIPTRIYVDEYQDSAPVDARIYRLLGNHGAQLYFIGDPRQAIYGFRGADPRNLDEAWNDADAVAQLTVNFRSDKMIVERANQIETLLKTVEYKRYMRASTDQAGTIRIERYETSEAEMMAAAEWIMARQAEGKTVAALCRYNDQARQMAGILRGHGGKVTCSAEAMASDHRQTLEESLERIRKTATGLPITRSDMTLWGIPMEHQDWLEPQIKQLRQVADLRSLRADESDPEAAELQVTTIHGAKGLEWDAVAILGADSRAFPTDSQEAGRLLYVAATRARNDLSVSWAASRPETAQQSRLTGLQGTQWI